MPQYDFSRYDYDPDDRPPYDRPPPRRRPPPLRRRGPLGLLAGVLVLLGLVAVGAWWFWPRQLSGLDPDAEPRPVVARGDLAADEMTRIEIVKKASPGVVHITRLG